MEARGRSLLLRKLGGLLCFRESKGVTALVTTTWRASTTTTVAMVFILLVVLSLLIEVGVAGGTGRRSGRRAHGEARKGRLIASVRMLVWCVHGDSQLLLSLLGELECVDLRRNATHGTRREGVDLTQLLWLEQAHVHILLVRSCDLLLLLLEQLDLLLDGQLFHYGHVSQCHRSRAKSPRSYSSTESAQMDFSDERYGACAPRDLVAQFGFVDP